MRKLDYESFKLALAMLAGAKYPDDDPTAATLRVMGQVCALGQPSVRGTRVVRGGSPIRETRLPSTAPPPRTALAAEHAAAGQAHRHEPVHGPPPPPLR